jgi:hypothetical protein
MSEKHEGCTPPKKKKRPRPSDYFLAAAALQTMVTAKDNTWIPHSPKVMPPKRTLHKHHRCLMRDLRILLWVKFELSKQCFQQDIARYN